MKLLSEVWHPPPDLVENSNVVAFMRKHNIPDSKTLIKKSVENPEWFWSSAADELGCEWYRPYDRVLDVGRGPEWAKWFVGGRVNIARTGLDTHARSKGESKTAFIWAGEKGELEEYSYRRLFLEVNRLANGLKSLGVRRGDVVATYLPMLPEAVVTLYATVKMGAVFLPIFSGFGSSALSTRLRDSTAKVLITADETYRRGRPVELKRIADESLQDNDAVRNVVVRRRTGVKVSWHEGRDVWWSDLSRDQSEDFAAEELDSDHPALLLYTSGTTGSPKGAVISHIGAILQPAKEIYFNLDYKEGNRFSWISDIGWMMGPWQIIGCQQLGGTHLIFEGAPDYPSPDRIWKMVKNFELTHLGGSATVFRLLKSFGDKWLVGNDLSSLRMIGNTGEPIDNDTWRWLLTSVGHERCPIINLSGGTEIFGCFLLPLPTMPLKPSTLGAPGLGMDVEVFDDKGRPVRGQIGFLVCKHPSPSMTRGFWHDPDSYIETYWSRWRKVWYHGDWASVDEDGYWFLHGRADDVINIGGKRMGPAEVESVIDKHPGVRESAVIGRTHQVKGEELICFVSLNPEARPSGELKQKIKNSIVTSIGKPFSPGDVIFVKDLPRNRAGKIMRRVIRAVTMGEAPKDLSILENPESVDAIKKVI